MNPNLKTQVRFGQRDLEILTKVKGSQELFRQVDLKEFIGDNVLPGYDHDIKFRRYTE